MRAALLLVAAVLSPLVFGALLFGHGWLRDVPDPRFASGAVPFEISAMSPLVPGPGLPADLAVDDANNNLDIARYGDRFFLGFRTAPHHWATDSARIHIVSSADRESWTHEATFDLDGRDLREPRFLVLGDRLLFYFFEAEDSASGFAPLSIRASERGSDGTWSESRAIFEPGYVVWRAKVRAGRAWMSVYRGSELYEESGGVQRTRLLTSEDGLNWTSVSGEASPISVGGTSECAFEIDDQGNLVAVVRIEARGSIVCTAPAERLERWDCTESAYRHDSPILFREGGQVYALARRSLGGPMERGPGWWPDRVRFLWAQLRYWFTRKRTTLYEVDAEQRRMVPLIDLPSRGDTAFAGVVRLDDGSWWGANYTSPLDGIDPPWVVGQSRPTHIVSFDLKPR